MFTLSLVDIKRMEVEITRRSCFEEKFLKEIKIVVKENNE